MPLSQAGRSNRLGIVSCGGLRLAMSRDDSCSIGSGATGIGRWPAQHVGSPAIVHVLCALNADSSCLHPRGESTAFELTSGSAMRQCCMSPSAGNGIRIISLNRECGQKKVVSVVFQRVSAGVRRSFR